MKKIALFFPAFTATLIVLAAWTPVVGEGDADALFNKGLELQKSGKVGEALDLYEKCLMLDTRHFKALLAQGAVHYSRGDYRQAVRPFKRLAAFYPDSKKARLYLGHTRLALGKIAGARKAFRRVLIDSPNNVPALIGLGRAEYRAGNRFAAVDTLKKALALQPDNKSLKTTIGDLEIRNRKYLRIAEKERRQRLKMALNNAVAEASIAASRKKVSVCRGAGCRSLQDQMVLGDLMDSESGEDHRRGSDRHRGRSGKDQLRHSPIRYRQ